MPSLAKSFQMLQNQTLNCIMSCLYHLIHIQPKPLTYRKNNVSIYLTGPYYMPHTLAPLHFLITAIGVNSISCLCCAYQQYFPGGSDGKVSVYNVGDLGLIPGLGRFPGEGNGNLLQYSCLENPMDGRSLVSMGSQRVGHDWETSLSLFTSVLLWGNYTISCLVNMLLLCLDFGYCLWSCLKHSD